MTFHGYHRNKKLAERHRKQLEREHGLVFVIAHRLNRHGEESLRGKHFVFKSLKKKIKKLRQFLITTKYKQKGRKFIRLDFLVNAESKAEARKMVQKQMKLSRSGFSKWRVQISENLEARPRKKSIELN